MEPKRADWEITWKPREGGRKPAVTPNPDFPHGIHVDGSDDEKPRCRGELPYVMWPERGLGLLIVKCRICDMSIAITTAGRPDDPISLTQNCKTN